MVGTWHRHARGEHPEFDASEDWAYDGARDCAHWLSWRVGLANLCLLCPFHHRLVHEGKHGVEVVDGELVSRREDGTVIPKRPERCEVEGDGARALALRNEEAGLRIDAETNEPLWDGTPLDLGEAVAALF